MPGAFYLPYNRLYSQSTSRFVHDAGLYKFRNVAFRWVLQPERNPANSIDNCLRFAHSDALNRANSLRWTLQKLIFPSMTFVRQSTWQFPRKSTKLDCHSNIAKYFLDIQHFCREIFPWILKQNDLIKIRFVIFRSVYCQKNVIRIGRFISTIAT